MACTYAGYFTSAKMSRIFLVGVLLIDCKGWAQIRIVQLFPCIVCYFHPHQKHYFRHAKATHTKTKVGTSLSEQEQTLFNKE